MIDKIWKLFPLSGICSWEIELLNNYSLTLHEYSEYSLETNMSLTKSIDWSTLNKQKDLARDLFVRKNEDISDKEDFVRSRI